MELDRIYRSMPRIIVLLSIALEMAHGNWMRHLTDSKTFRSLTNPDTYQTIARHGYEAVCQDGSIVDQYRKVERFVENFPDHVVKPTERFLTETMGHGQSSHYTERNKWMGHLPDSKSLSSLTIPGTHQTMALHGTGAVCQHRSITEQYRMGVRFVDIRCRWFGNALPIHHGRYYQHAGFTDDVVKPTVRFLRENPTETILMLVKDEQHNTEKGTLSFSTLVRNSFSNAGASVLHGVPNTLGEARGRIILFHKDWPENDCGLGTSLYGYFDVHDDWNEHNGDKRWNSARSHLDEAINGKPQDPYITYVSGYIDRGVPDTWGMANHLNPKLRAYVKGHSSSRLGVVLFDMVPDDIVGDLINCN